MYWVSLCADSLMRMKPGFGIAEPYATMKAER